MLNKSKPVFRIRTTDPHEFWSARSGPDPGGQEDPQNYKKNVVCSLNGAEGFSSSLDVLYGGLLIS